MMEIIILKICFPMMEKAVVLVPALDAIAMSKIMVLAAAASEEEVQEKYSG